MKEKLLILDSNSIIHRVYHALPPLTTKKGELINAVYGFLLVLFRVIKEFRPKYICACFDFPAKTFRHERFKEYKAQRPPCPKDLASQIPKIKEVLKVFGIPIFEKEGFEADDLIGTLVARSKGVEKIIISGDLDTLQLISEETKVFVLSGIKKSVLYGMKEVEKKYQGLKPEQLSDFKALVGDQSDNIPGVLGIGEKSAIELLKKFHNLENLYREIAKNSENAKRIQPKIKTLLLKNKDQILFNKTLTIINKNVPINFDLQKCEFGKYTPEKVIEAFKKLEFYSLIKRLAELQLPAQRLNSTYSKKEQKTLF